MNAEALNAGAPATTAIDTGGTFTDLVLWDGRSGLRSLKLPGAGALPARLDDALSRARREQTGPVRLLHGSTLATNALLSHTLPPIALLVTSGFRELLEINGAHCDDHHEPTAGHPLRHRLVPLEHVHEVTGRIGPDGQERVPLDQEALAETARRVAASGVAAVAVTLLYSYLDPAHEARVRAIIAREAPALPVVLSSEVLPEMREYERAVVTCLNAALLPLMNAFLAAVEPACPAGLLLMQSSGGLATPYRARQRPLTTALSGPAAAVLLAGRLARRLHLPRAISIDVGGTSTDVALLEDGRHRTTTAAEIAGYPLRTPAIEIITIGAGGGSIARAGADQRWRVGPDSAGADPGPACYGRGGLEVTLTDAQLVLGRLPDALLGGNVPLDRARAHAALTAFGRARGFDAETTALGLLRIASHAMCGAIRRVTAARGEPPEAHTLIALGGAGPLHAAELADLLGIRRVLVPPEPGLAAARGLLEGALREDAVRSFNQRCQRLDPEGTAACLAALEYQASAALLAAGVAPLDIVLTRAVDARYLGMSSEFSVPLRNGTMDMAALQEAIDSFHALHAQHTGWSYAGVHQVELVSLRVTAEARLPGPPWPRLPPTVAPPSACGSRRVRFVDGAPIDGCPIFRRHELGAGSRLAGPSILEQYDATLLVPPGWSCDVDAEGNAWLSH